MHLSSLQAHAVDSGATVSNSVSAAANVHATTAHSAAMQLSAQFYRRYPTGGLITELLIIHEGKFVVRAQVQVGDQALATGMAAAFDLEVAEDRAKVRALETAGLSIVSGGAAETAHAPAPVAAASSPAPSFSTESSPPPQGSVQPAAIAPLPSVTPRLEPLESFPSSAPSLADVSWKSVGEATPASTASPALDISAPESGSKASTSLQDRVAPPARPASHEPPGLDSVFDNTEAEAFDFSLTSEEAIAPPSQPAPALQPETQYPEPDSIPTKPLDKGESTDSSELVGSTNKGESVPEPKPQRNGKPGRRKAKAEPSLQAPPAATDLSDIIAQTSIELKRLGWSEVQGRDYLQKTYGKRSRQQLTDPELLEFLEHLQAQPSPS